MARIVTLLLLSAGLLSATAGPASAKDVLPDLVQYQPYQLSVAAAEENGARRFHLGFASNVQNWGYGPLEIHGSRPSQDTPEMTAEQVITTDDGSKRTHPGAGTMRYVDSQTHQHWHYLKFDTYELRRANDFKLMGPDRKTGFCLGDRFKLNYDVINPRTPEPLFVSQCGGGKPELLEMTEGISVGYGDDYGAHIEGQYVDVTRLKAGDYYLVHRANPQRRLLESNYSNNVASVGIRVSWPKGRSSKPRVKQMEVCRHSDHCPFARRHSRGRQWHPVKGQPRTVVSAPRVVPSRATLCRFG